MARRVRDEDAAAAREALADAARQLATPSPTLEEPFPLTPNPRIADRRPAPDSFEELAELVADVLAYGPAEAARRHGISRQAAYQRARVWQRHPRVVELVRVRWPAIQAARRRAARERGEASRVKLAGFLRRKLRTPR